MELRPYQKEAIAAVFNWWGQDNRVGENPLVVLPTASGKTVIFCSLIQKIVKDYPGTRILILAHRKELIAQAEEKLLMLWPDAPVAVYAASLNRREVSTITIASRDTIVNHLDDLGVINLIIIDEAHHIAPDMETRYRNIITVLTEENPRLHTIGFTATPYRKGQGYIYGDSEKHLFQGVAYEANILDLVEQGHLTRITAKAVASEAVADLSEVKTTGGDFNLGDLEKAVAAGSVIKSCVDEWERCATDRKSTVFFCVTVKHAMMVHQELGKRGVHCPVISGNTSQIERDAILKDFQKRRIVGVVNVAVLTEGWDAPVLDCICLMRPTKSLSLYLQIVGRGLRLYPNKENTLLLDFGQCLERFGPIDKAKPEKKGNGEAVMKECPDCGAFIYAGFINCPECKYHFENGVICPECQCLNTSRAIHCLECDHLLREVETKASNKAVLSTDIRPEIIVVKINEIKAYVQYAKATRRPYLTISFSDGLFQTYLKRLMIGYPGYAGQKAVKGWRVLTKENVKIPEDPFKAAEWITEFPHILKPIKSINVDINSKWQDVVGVNL